MEVNECVSSTNESDEGLTFNEIKQAMEEALTEKERLIMDISRCVNSPVMPSSEKFLG